MRKATEKEIKRFTDYRAKHVALVQRIARLVFNMDCSNHDHDKIECSAEDLEKWSLRNLMQDHEYEPNGEDKKELLRIAAVHMKTQPHHPQYWDKSLSVEDLTENPGANVVATSMTEKALKEMISDWCSVAVKINSSLFKFYNANCTGDNPKIKFSSRQKRIIISGIQKVMEKIPEEKLYWEGKEYKVEQVDPIIEDDDLMDLKESILDIPRKDYCGNILNDNGKMKDEVLSQIKDTINLWKEQINFDFKIKGIEAKGSLLSKRYNNTSDLDVSILTNMTEDQVNEVYSILPKGENIKGTEHPIDFYLLGENDKVEEKNLDNIYDVMNNKWIKRTEEYENEIPTDYLIQVCNFYINGCVIALNNYKNDKTLLEYYKSLDPESHDISKEEKVSIIEDKKRDLKADLDSLRIALHMITSFRTEAYEEAPFNINIEIKSDNPHNSINEQLAKILEKFGIREELRDAVDECGKIFKGEISLEEACDSSAFIGHVPDKLIDPKKLSPETTIDSLKLKESENKTAAFCFGRNNPPTTGHLLLWEEVSKANADAHLIYTSHSQDKKKNPLDYETKVSIIEKCIEDYHLNAEFINTEARTYIDVLVDLFHKGYPNIIVVAGKDRLEELLALARKYNDISNKEGSAYHFDSIEGHEAGDRDPDSEGVNGISGTKMRQFIKEGNFEEFKKFFPIKDEEIAQQIFDKAYAYLN